MRGLIVGNVSRRHFLGGAFAVAGTLPFASLSSAATPGSAHVVTSAAPGYRSLGVDEAAFVETMVNALCPADALTVDGVSSGLAAFIDAHVAGDVDAAAHGHAELFRAGLASADAACRQRFGVAFRELTPAAARQFLRDIASGDVDADFPLMSWSSDLLDPMLKQACFSGPVYDTYGSRMFVKLFG